MKIILLGYMASGKSTVSRLLAKKLGLNAIDLDDYIIKKEGASIHNIFKNKGEIYFRVQENKYLLELLTSDKSFVLALGGGTPCYANNIDIIKNHSNSIYLKANLITLFDRLYKEKENRPLITALSKEKLKEFIAKHLFERAIFYDQADHIIHIDNKTVTDIVDETEVLL
ncbi:MAG: AAA family ATPase [Flavobacteriaceae bacterium]|nr:AAA family ATPase [Flavobacteriaceae bacterium]